MLITIVSVQGMPSYTKSFSGSDSFGRMYGHVDYSKSSTLVNVDTVTITSVYASSAGTFGEVLGNPITTYIQVVVYQNDLVVFSTIFNVPGQGDYISWSGNHVININLVLSGSVIIGINQYVQGSHNTGTGGVASVILSGGYGDCSKCIIQ